MAFSFVFLRYYKIMQDFKTGKLYRHYKGNLYRIISIARHSETLEDMIVYQSEKDGQVWVRPYSMWNDTVDDKNTLRFTLIED